MQSIKLNYASANVATRTIAAIFVSDGLNGEESKEQPLKYEPAAESKRAAQ